MSLRYFLTYRGVKLPLQLAEELPADALHNRNTYFRAQYDELDRLLLCEKLVYGDVEMSHRYEYDGNGRLLRATVAIGDEEPQVMQFDVETAS